ncbi:MAG: hypothetical protein LBJ57_01220, partial [Prevotellaceae bacterium]|nr:hypothetical protein [Prevotellaceae bacterium]
MISYYQKNIAACNELLLVKHRRSALYSAMRGGSFLCLLVVGYFAIAYQAWGCWLGLALFTATFIAFLRSSRRVGKEISRSQALRNVYEQELASIVHQQFPNADGSEFCDPNHPYANDLDVFGNRSLFHLLNRCYTTDGRSYLAAQLKHPPEDVARVYLRQEALKELCSSHKDWIFEMLASLSVKRKHQAVSGENIHAWLQQPHQLTLPKAVRLLTQAAPPLNVILLGLALLYNPHFSVALLLFFIPQAIIQRRYGRHVRRIKSALNALVADVAGFDVYSDMLAGAAFLSPELRRIQHPIAAYGRLTPQLHRMLSVFDMGDTFWGFLVNALLFSNLRTAIKLEKWRRQNRDRLPQLIEHICEWEAMLSLAIFSINHPTFAFPAILEEDSPTVINAKALGHPLIAAEKRVSNDVLIVKADFFIITGANMAGKSAFLRTVGVNLLLARIGAPACASSFQCTPVQLFTSMRTADSLDSGQSYFYAEALRFR